jgi:hypothetical protein
MRCDAMRCDAMQCDAMRCDAMLFAAADARDHAQVFSFTGSLGSAVLTYIGPSLCMLYSTKITMTAMERIICWWVRAACALAVSQTLAQADHLRGCVCRSHGHGHFCHPGHLMTQTAPRARAHLRVSLKTVYTSKMNNGTVERKWGGRERAPPHVSCAGLAGTCAGRGPQQRAT